MADLEQIREFIHRYADVENTVNSLERVREVLTADSRAKAELRLYRHGEHQPFFKYEVAMNVAANYLQNQLTAKQSALSNMDTVLAEMVVE